VLLFVDLDRPGEPTETGCDETSERLGELLEGLGPYTDTVQVVISSERARGRRLEDLRAELGLPLRTQLVGNLWDDVPPAPLPRYEHINYWLTRRHVWRLPSWFAVLPDDHGWPADQQGKLVRVADPPDWAATSQALRARLGRYYWTELWWGDGPPPDAAARWRAHALMVAWSLPRRRWQRVLGQTTPEFEARLDLLLKIHAGAQRYVRAGIWYPHWVHLPRAGLGMHRPIELMEVSGLQGIEHVLAHVWQPDDPTVSVPPSVARAWPARPSNY
jgi:hypothetical protein